ncbi:hypothetical protein EDE08_109364 [Bradyrhizobium sp. R2.2-H]|jgi:hypothetical protein|uniref:hypothetical protein n=1 Tax=unclassified Bradyrhizobium TaxID=2631580 RepID=UPI0010471AA4|nr:MULTISPECIES: hypothetical protein [unclassified Bradyrhizobium]TCU68239.1 hypothetical protein EDE10_10949 [Bradyrhizobium sp. Y-H1]TCU70139.1 hypothetical protein EDE08_109364 [Bradyrhizobium sp. R2.2-H]
MNVHFVFETKAGRVTDYRLPGAIFHSRQAYNEFAPERRAYEAAVAAYADDPCADLELRVDLSALGYSTDDIEWHLATPGARLAADYRTAADLGVMYG